MTHITLPTDWPNCATVSVRGILAEAVTAEVAHSKGGDVTWIGNFRPGHDVVTTADDGTEVKRDAKSVVVSANGTLTLARRNAQPFDPAKVDVLTLVQLDDTATGFEVDLGAGRVRMHAEAKIVAVWEVPVEDLNDMLPVPEPGVTWRNVIFELAELEPYRAR